TFLKILSRITEPSSGRVELRGRVGSLLEVGTGFHPELTGRENLYLNGAILGMGHREVARKFDQIVAFSEIEPFLDTPVKRYSSGMYVRLAFAVAAHLEPDILIIDEVLAVGDAQFQEKCLGRMDEVRRAGRTVLFVSHNMAAVRSLCTRAVLLEKGRVTMNDTTEQVVQHYLQAGRARVCARSVPENAYRITNDRARILHVAVHSLDGAPQYQYCFQQPFQVTFQCELLEDVPDGHFEVSVSTLEGTHILYATTIDGGNKPQYLKRGQHQVNAIVDNILLPREYAIDVGVHCQSGETYDFVPNACGFEVVNIGVDGNDHYPWPTTRGHVRGTANWSSSFQSTTTATRN
ncbi:MAG: ABC transporter ATP-binding protein, partial [Planctomycetales bacterium]|nr:ABC transporter ATP-binding protein [Planctomycetales bacterium]